MVRVSACNIVVLAVALAGCAGLEVTPNGGMYPSPVTVSVSSGADIEIGSLRARVDGVDRTVDFVYASSGTRSLSAQLVFAPGTHTVQATANVWNGYDRRYDPKSAQATFEAAPTGSLTLTISPTAVALLPGATATINLTIARSGAFAGDVRVAESDSLYGTGNTATIGAADLTGSIPVTARASAGAGAGTRTISASGTLFSTSVSDRQALAFRVAHRPGPFSRASFSARTAGQSALASDGQTTLNVENGAPGAARFEARFKRPTNSIGATVGFEPGVPATGGAGFCATDAFGFVLSGGSPTTGHNVTLVLVEDAFGRVPIAFAAGVPNGAVVSPEIFFSRDCAVVITVGADTQTQRAFRANVYDVNQRRPVCSVAFDAAPPSLLVAELLAPLGDNQQLRITVGGQATICPMFF